MPDGDLVRWKRALRERARVIDALATGAMADRVARLSALVAAAARGGRKVLLFGNGGSAAAAQHAAAELVGRFEKERRPLAAIALTTDTSILSAVANDYGFDRVFARQIEALAEPGDVAIGLSTSGRSPNVLAGLESARRRGAATAALLGQGGGPARRLADLPIVVPASRVALIQEAHELIIHVVCEEIDRQGTPAGRRKTSKRPR
ncbi:MAG TPA: SIS domain-containing protein [Vicinamibacterales bacterium]|jgi:D-sedoheptulose 7-phosphate isomerase|nr:SIS domain-containing protein [Vicinamibacterales bacterium]